MKTVLCFGDSNTWGYDPASGQRLPAEQRWTGVLQAELGHDYCVIAEGQNGRTTVWDDPIEGTRFAPGGHGKNGARYLLPCLESHHPVDLVVLALGVNDLKARFSLPAEDIARACGQLIDMVRACPFGPGGGAPEVLLLAPAPVGKLTAFATMFAGAQEKSRLMGRYYRAQAEERGCGFLDAGEIITTSDVDGIHFEAPEHAKLGKAVAEAVRLMMEQDSGNSGRPPFPSEP